MEGEHTPIIIWLILSMDLTLVQFKISQFNSSFFQQTAGNKWRINCSPL